MALPSPSIARPRSHSDEIGVPRGALIGAAALIALTLSGVAAVRLSGTDISRHSTAPVVAERLLQFRDRPDGGIEVLESGRTLVQLPAGEHGFLRGTLRTLARERRMAGLAAEASAGPRAPQTDRMAAQAPGADPAPVRLRAHADGRLALEDPLTGERIDLESFGPSNAAVFAQLLRAPANPAAAADPSR